MNNLIPWKWNYEGGGAAGYSTALHGMFEIECIGCSLNQSSRPTCEHQKNYYNGTYPRAAPPSCWFITEDGTPICTDKKRVAAEKVPENLKVLQDPHEEPLPPTPDPPAVPPTLYHAESGCLFVTDDMAELDVCLAQGLDIATKETILKVLYETVLKG